MSPYYRNRRRPFTDQMMSPYFRTDHYEENHTGLEKKIESLAEKFLAKIFRKKRK
jgi:hypothetical protein